MHSSLLLTSLLSATTVLVTESPNLIQNPSFESRDVGTEMPVAWTVDAPYAEIRPVFALVAKQVREPEH